MSKWINELVEVTVKKRRTHSRWHPSWRLANSLSPDRILPTCWPGKCVCSSRTIDDRPLSAEMDRRGSLRARSLGYALRPPSWMPKLGRRQSSKAAWLGPLLVVALMRWNQRLIRGLLAWRKLAQRHGRRAVGCHNLWFC